MLTVQEIEALCAAAGVELHIGEHVFDLWAVTITDYNTGVLVVKYAKSAAYAANEAWDKYVNDRRD